MAIEQELQTLHTNLKALGSAREKLDLATEHVATVTDAIVKVGDSMKRLSEMPELTERVRTSVDRMINASKDLEILNAVTSLGAGVQAVATSIQTVSADISRLEGDVVVLSRETREDFLCQSKKIDSTNETVSKCEAELRAEINAVRDKQASTGKLVVTILILTLLQFVGIVALAVRIFK